MRTPNKNDKHLDIDIGRAGNNVAPGLQLIEAIRVEPALCHVQPHELNTRRWQRRVDARRSVVAQHHHISPVAAV